MTGLPTTSAGQSHSWVTPTSSSPRPSAQTISVADGSRETIRICGLRFRTREARTGRAGRGAREDDARVLTRLELVDAGAGGGLVRVPGGVDLGVLGPFGREGLFGEDRIDRAFGLAGATVDAL